ncbi:TIGR03619 family F420-dependent LLM class oxidoreductase [Mycobacterium paraseoulense]|uniref:LLM class F420-dependent oxidoreductase n=1 Tax=Mycobacterium paraseoulense TaxID=590652 RepID=A0A1X0IF86_9MYCO|nr:TIGR03619 family F420-dependent LLM class oxidoreductase [Mycobacterium paraseoulense]MCV7393691.1 TIGR03619 family F420-dependent LLM class oxidoreductase [Mycobacterium paraseoulense]ORB45555.1 LLM class F420-dependent oxidoreductase [Mycobacterium paraseoulense]BBZ70695.1 LLM class F420-dependent oxidoreductase [Mycobacterium paraseoulense]
MKFHVLLPGCVDTPAITQPWESTLTGADIVRIAQVADECGFEGLLIPEHFVVAADHAETTGRHFVHSTTAQAIMAGATRRIKLGSMVTILPLHNPIVLAKSLATLDWLSGGRAAVTVGLGWQPDEYRAVGVPWEERGARANEYLAAIFELWHNQAPSFDGKYVNFADITFEPKPIQEPHPTVWVAGDADAALRRAARFGDGWAPWLTPPGQIPEKLDRLRSFAEFDGRPLTVFYSLMALLIGLDDTGHVPLDDQASVSSAETQRVVDACGQLATLGVTDTWVPPAPVSELGEYLDSLRWLSEEVIPQLRAA